jgi:RNA-binding protein
VAKKRKASPPPAPLTGKQKSFLRSLAHKLKPVVQVGRQGATDAVLAAVEVALERHELIKVKVSVDAEADVVEIAPALEKGSRSQVAQIIGHTVVLYRRRERDPKIVLPRIKVLKPGASKPPRHVPGEGADLESYDDDDADDVVADEDDVTSDERVADDEDDLE